MILLGIDLETSGLQLDSSILEVACVLYDTDLKSVFRSWCSLVWDPLYPPPFEDALRVNGLRVEELQKHGIHPTECIKTILKYVEMCDVLIGHNAIGFDKPVLDNAFTKYGFSCISKTWLDSRTDFEYPQSTTSKRLVHLAVDHDCYIPRAHKALFDVYMMLDIVSHYDVSKALERSGSPIIKIECCPNDMSKNGELKKNRYRWNPDKKVWWKEIREVDFDKERSSVSVTIWRENGKEKTSP